MKIFKRQYRIVTDNFNGFEVQVRFWYWPFWIEAEFINTYSSLDAAKKYILDKKAHLEFKSKEVERFKWS